LRSSPGPYTRRLHIAISSSHWRQSSQQSPPFTVGTPQLQRHGTFSWFGLLSEDGDEVAIRTPLDNVAASAGVEGAEKLVRGSSDPDAADEGGTWFTTTAAGSETVVLRINPRDAILSDTVGDDDKLGSMGIGGCGCSVITRLSEEVDSRDAALGPIPLSSCPGSSGIESVTAD
jgi:hypothetical protein